MKALLFFIISFLYCTGLLSQTTYTWVGTDNASWAISTNWSPARTTPAVNDILVFNDGATKNVTAVPTQTVGRISVTGNTSITLQISAGTITLTIGNGAGDDFVINSGSSLTIGGAGTSLTVRLANNATADISGTLTINNGRTYHTNGTAVVTAITGTLINNGTVTCTSATKLLFSESAIYRHTRNGGTIPTATWDIASDCLIEGVTGTAPGGLNQAFGNFTWNCTGQTANLSLPAGGMSVDGNFTLESTGNASQLQANQSPLLTGGNFTLRSGTLRLATNAAKTLTVTGNVVITGGTLLMSSGNNTGSLNVSGNFSHTGGIINESGNGNGEIIFDGTGIQVYTSGGTVSNTINFIVNNGATLQMANGITAVIGGGSFTLSGGGTLGITSSNGITASGATGNIQVTGTRSFNTAANYIYNGAANQVTGNGLPATINNLTISNAAGVILDAARSISGVLTLAEGQLTTSAINILTLLPGAAVSGASDISFVNGPVQKRGNEAFVFPIGKIGTGYMPLSISAPLNTTDAFSAEYIRASATALGPVTDPNVTHVSNCEYWQLNRTSGSSNVNVTLSWNINSGCNGSYINTMSSLWVCHFNGTSWDVSGNDAMTGTPANGTITWNNVSVFSPFTIGSSGSANPLPVIFANERAYEYDSGIRVEWSNLTETGVFNYTIERSSDSRLFIPVGVLAPRSNLNGREDYIWFDPSPPGGNNYYRVRATEYDNKTILSKVMKVTTSSKKSGVKLYPNPVKGSQIQLQLTKMKAGEYIIQVLSPDGRSVHRYRLIHPGGSSAEILQLPPSLTPGVYNLLIIGAEIKESRTFILL